MCHVRDCERCFCPWKFKEKKKSSNFHLNNFRPHLNLPAKAAVITLNTYFTHRISISKWVLYTQNITYCSKIEKRIWFQMCTLGVYIISSSKEFYSLLQGLYFNLKINIFWNFYIIAPAKKNSKNVDFSLWSHQYAM